MDSEFIQYWLAAVGGVVVLMAVSLYHKSHERRVDLPAKNIHIPRPYTAEELREFDGVRSTNIFVGVKGVIYSVAKEWYGPESPYNAFAGHEASRQLGKTKVGREEANADWTTLSLEHLKTLDEWEERFMGKYLAVGWFVPDAEYISRGASFAP